MPRKRERKRGDLMLYRGVFTDRHGQRRESPNYQGEYRDLRGRRRKIALTDSYGNSYSVLRQLVDALKRAANGEVVPTSKLPPLVRTRFYQDLKRGGHKAAETANPQTAWAQYVAEFQVMLRAEQNVEIYIANTCAYVREVGNGCGFQTVRDFDDAGAIKAYLDKQCRAKEFGLEAANHRIRAARRFCLWLFKDKRVLAVYPLRGLEMFNAATDRRRKRRALTAEEVVTLLTTTESAPCRGGFTGHERALIYRVALESGLRRNEIKTLCWSAFDLEGDLPTVTVEATNTKNRRTDQLPLRPRTARLLAAWRDLQRNTDADRAAVFTQTARWCDTHKIIRKDLEAAEIPFETADGRIDFHSLRVSFITALARGDVHPKKAQELARHCSIEMTMQVYTKLRTTKLAPCLDVLPDTPEEPAAKTRAS